MDKTEFLKLSKDEQLKFIQYGTEKTEPSLWTVETLQKEISRIENETRRAKEAFRQIAERCPVEWFRPS